MQYDYIKSELLTKLVADIMFSVFFYHLAFPYITNANLEWIGDCSHV